MQAPVVIIQPTCSSPAYCGLFFAQEVAPFFLVERISVLLSIKRVTLYGIHNIE
jgi:hypothetical protein